MKNSSLLFFILLIILSLAASFVPAYFGEEYLAFYQRIALWIGGVISFVSLILIIAMKKIGVITYPISVFIEIVILTKGDLLFSLPLIFVLFLFTGYGLVFIIPEWKNFS